MNNDLLGGLFLLGIWNRNKQIDKRLTALEEQQSIPQDLLNEREELIQECLDVIDKLQRAGMGNNRIDKARKFLERGNLLSRNDLQYVGGKYSVLEPYLKTISDEYSVASHDIRMKWGKGEITTEKARKILVELSDKYQILQQQPDKSSHTAFSIKDELQVESRETKTENVNDNKWILETIEKLEEAKIGDSSRLSAMKFAMEKNRPIYQSDRQYLRDRYKIWVEQNLDKSKSIESEDASKTIQKNDDLF
jgi:hypothetical protein